MAVSKDRFRDGQSWDEWMERLGEGCSLWQERFDATALGPLRADFQQVPTPRHVLCLFDPDAGESMTIVPAIARACEQAGAAGAVELRLFPIQENEDLASQYFTGGERTLPLCVVFDRDWVQLALWSPRHELTDEGLAPLLSEFHTALLGTPLHPWQAGREAREHLRKQARRAQ